MAEFNLIQAEADALIKMEKHRINDERNSFPFGGESLTLPLQSPDKREGFLLDIYRGAKDLAKIRYQNRARQIIILVRLEIKGPPHRNPDEEEIPCPHLHLYREGFGDKWVIPLPTDIFKNIEDLWQTLEDFMKYCNITKTPFIERGLF